MNNSSLNKCPVCSGAEIRPYLKVKDHFLSQEYFEVLQCMACGLGITQPQPDPNIIGKYYESEKYISHQSKRKGALEKVYNAVQKINLKLKLKTLRPLSSSSTVIDYGAGSGHFMKFLNENNVTAIGIEPSEIARTNAAAQGIDLKDLSYLQNITPGSIHRITMWHVLEHVHALHNTIKQLSSLLSEDGSFIVAVPNYQSKDAQVYKEHWAALDVPRHLWHFSQQSLEILFSTYGFRLCDIQPMKFDAFYVSILSEKYKNGHLLKGLVNGLVSNLQHQKFGGYSSNIYRFFRV